MRTVNLSNLNVAPQRDSSYDRGHSMEPKRTYTRQNTQENNAINRTRNEIVVQDFGYSPTTPFEDSPNKRTPTNSTIQTQPEFSASKNYFIPNSAYKRKGSVSQDRKSKSDLISMSISHRNPPKTNPKSISRDASPDFNYNYNSPQFEASRVTILRLFSHFLGKCKPTKSQD